MCLFVGLAYHTTVRYVWHGCNVFLLIVFYVCKVLMETAQLLYMMAALLPYFKNVLICGVSNFAASVGVLDYEKSHIPITALHSFEIFTFRW